MPQKGAIAWQIEYQNYRDGLQDSASRQNKLFRDVAGIPAAGDYDVRARQQLASQAFLLNLANDGFGGRCDPLSKLMLVAQHQAASGDSDAGSRLLQKLFSAAAVLNNPQHYSAEELANAEGLIRDLAEIHKSTEAYYASKEGRLDIVQGKWGVTNKQLLTLDQVLAKMTPTGPDGQMDLSQPPIYLELDVPGHADHKCDCCLLE
ncbi:hypothetical protein [Photobacterium lipolyticum]|uniref:Uncharacterized protein n=1 Tax=Photobacterium lipolyticum TaxID=266810 RepID=A0A2T3N3A9_9GAMM|nr:hypothetical protein [Photobacterium lipolyticum]PSW06820.1 hypothetical protein C9I89_04690 [Photobacterium lipolyticum]